MACEITIDLDSAVAIQSDPGQPPDRIELSGTAEDCKKVSVILLFDGHTAGPVLAEVDEDTGEWTAVFQAPEDFTQGDFPCDAEAVKIQAHCDDAPDCGASPSLDKLPCQPAGGCSITIDVDSAIAIQSDPGQPPDRVEVSGTAAGCSSVTVTLSGPPGDPHVAADVDPNTGQWTAVFQAPGDFDLGDITCGMEDIKIRAECKNNPDCFKDDQIPVLPCIGTGDCPTSAELTLLDGAGNPVDASDCVPPGDYTLRVTSPTGSNIFYLWSLDNQTQLGSSGTGQDEFAVSVPDGGSVTVSVVIQLPDIENCFLSAAAILTACEEPPPSAECPDELTLTVADANGNVIDANNVTCLAPGRYILRVSAPSGAGITYSWSVDGDLQAGETGNTFEFNLTAGETHTITAVAVQSGCPPLSGGVELTGCVVCPTGVTLEVLNSDREPVDPDDGCLPAGAYTLRVTFPTGPGHTFTWSVDGQLQQSATGSTFTYDLAEGEEVEISVSVQTPGCPPVSAGVELEACDCPDQNVGIQVTTAGGAPVDPSQCLAPGTYLFTATGDTGDGNLQWTADGVPLGNGTEATFQFNPPGTVLSCGGPMPANTITLTAASDDPECPPATSTVTLTVCRRNILCIDCWLLRLLIILFATVAAIGAAVWLCPAVVVNPLIPQTAGLLPIAIAVAPWVTIIAAAIAVGLFLFWWWWCRPDWCNDWVVLFWQVLISTGFVFLYFGECPACFATLLPVGAALFGGGVVVFILWVIFCRPTLCKIFFEIGSLGLVQLVVGWLEFILGACIWAWGWAVQLAWQALLNLVGWIGTTINCNVNPNS